jgi:hypothetical protein
MTTAEARERLTQHGLSPEQAAGVVDVLERWEEDRVVTREYLDLRLGPARDQALAHGRRHIRRHRRDASRRRVGPTTHLEVKGVPS